MKLISGASSGKVKAIDTKSSSFLSAIEEDRKRKEAQAKQLQRDAVIADSNAKAEKYYQESTGGVLNTINRFLDPIIGGTKAVGATAKDVLTPWNPAVTPSVTYQGVEYKTPGQKGVEGGQKIAQGQIKQGLGQVGEGILDVAQFIPVGGAVVRGATKAVPIMQGLKNLGSLQGLKTAGVNLLKNKSVQQNAALMGGYGATGAMQENQGAGGIALETAKGFGIGAGAGLAFEGAGSLIGRAFTNLFEKIGTRPRVQIDETVARETVDEIADIQGKPPTPEEENAILEAFANGATKEEIVTEVGKAKVADGFEVKPKLAEVVDQLEANGEKLSLEDTMTVKKGLDEGKSFEEIQTSLRTPELAVKSTPEPRKVESNTNTPDNGDEAFLKSVETRFKESKTNKFREYKRDESGKFSVDSDAYFKKGDAKVVKVKDIDFDEGFTKAKEDVSKGRESMTDLPVLVRQKPNGRYEIIDGNHRVVAALKDGESGIAVMTNEPLYRRMAEANESKAKYRTEDPLLKEAGKTVQSSALKPENARSILRVAEDGKPVTVTVYHGSPDARFAEEFNPNKKGYFKDAPDLTPDNTDWNKIHGTTGGGFKTGKGVYEGISFTDDSRVAKSYSEKAAFDNQNAVPMVLQRTVTLQKPKVIDVAKGEWNISLEKTIAQAKKEGYDGIIFKNIKDNYHPGTTVSPSNNIIAFSQEQVKPIYNKAQGNPLLQEAGKYKSESAFLYDGVGLAKKGNQYENIRHLSKQVVAPDSFGTPLGKNGDIVSTQSIDEAQVQKYMKVIEEKLENRKINELPIVILEKRASDGKTVILDGHNRAEAYRRYGYAGPDGVPVIWKDQLTDLYKKGNSDPGEIARYIFDEQGAANTKDVAEKMGISTAEAYKKLIELEKQGHIIGVHKDGLVPRGKTGANLNSLTWEPKSQLTDLYNKAQGGKNRLADDFERVTGQKITPEQEAKIIALNKKLFGDEDVKITAQLLTPEGQKAFGVYKNKVIKILDGQADPTDTFYHEAVHKYLDLFTTLDEQKKIYVEARKVWKTDNLDELEEKIAENFIRYAKTSEGVTGTLKEMFDKVIDRIKVALGKESEIEALYKDILEGKAKKGNDSDYLLTAKEATKREKEILSDMKSKERALAKMEKATLDEEKFLARQSESTFISDPEEQHNYQSFKDLLRRFKGEKQRQELLNGDASSIKRVLGDKLKSEELDNILYSTDQSKSEDEMLDYFRGIYEKDKEKITSDMLVKKAQKRLESDPDYAKLQDELASVKERKLALEKAEQKTLDEVNKELAQQKPEIIEPKKVEVEKEVKPKTSVIASRLNEALPEGFKIDESYDPKVIKEEIDKASQTIFKDKEAAIKKAFDPNTNPVERDAILIELSEIAKRDGDFDAVADLFQRRAELIRSGAQSLNMEKASILLNPQEKYMRDIVNSRLGSVKVNGKDLTEVEVSAIRKIVRRETSEATKKAFKIQDAEELFKSLICT